MLTHTGETAGAASYRLLGTYAEVTEAVTRGVRNEDTGTWEYTTVNPGEILTVVSVINAGFNGMLVAVVNEAGVRVANLPQHLLVNHS